MAVPAAKAMLRPVTEAPPEIQDPAGDDPSRGPPDRRRQPTPMLSRYLFLGRRKGGRRGGETERIYVDRPGVSVIAACGLVTALSILDAFLTLDVLAKGGEEANPLMLAALSLGTGAFVILKTCVTVLGAGFLCLHKNWPLGRVCLWVALFFYAALTAWHLYGQWFVLR